MREFPTAAAEDGDGDSAGRALQTTKCTGTDDKRVRTYKTCGGVSATPDESGFVVKSCWDRCDNWLVGEPCTHSWYGIYCCPEDLPFLVRDPNVNSTFLCSQGRTFDAATPFVSLDDFRTRADQDFAPLGAGGCRNSDPYGYRDIEAGNPPRGTDRCVVAMVDLSSNGLHGVLDDTIGNTIPLLKVFDVRNNTLDGPIPLYAASRDWLYLGLSENKFYYTESYSVLNLRNELADATDSDVGTEVANLISHCKQSAERGGICSGLPPRSCDAFGSFRCSSCTFVVETMNPDRCMWCNPDKTTQYLFMIGAVALAVCSLLFYMWLTNYHPGALRGGVSTFIILYQHAQTVAIFEQFSTEWPPSIVTVFEIFQINLFSIEIGRPECLMGKVDETWGGPYYLISMFKFIGLLGIFVGIAVGQQYVNLRYRLALVMEHRRAQAWLRKPHTREEGASFHVERAKWKRRLWRQSAATTDRLELLESIMFGMQITMSARLIIEFLTMGTEGANGMGLSAIVGYVLAWFLLGYMIFIMLKYLVYLHALTFHTTPDDRHRAFQAWIRKEHYTLRNNRGENIEGIGEDEVSAIRWRRH